MISSQDDLKAFAAEYALGVLEDTEMARAEALVASDRTFAREVGGWRDRLAPLDATARPLAPSAALWQRIEAATAAQPRVVVRPHATPGLADVIWDRINFWRWSAMAGAAAALAMLVVVGAMFARWPSEPTMIAVLAADNGRPGAVVHAFADGSVRLIPLADIPVPQGRALQVWTLRDRQEGPISVGLLDKAQSVHLDLGKLPAPRTDQLFEITLEPENGSPTGRPTGPVLMKGLAASTL
jgi:anti-sigma-K factor RskA